MFFGPWAAVAWGGTDLSWYPAPEPGFRRMVFEVPEAPEENDRRVEVIVGRTMSTDCASPGFVGALTRREAPGGFPYYTVDRLMGPAMAAIACVTPRPREVFATVQGEGFLVRYNSQLPVVVYVPEGFEVRWRAWLPSATIGHAAPR